MVKDPINSIVEDVTCPLGNSPLLIPRYLPKGEALNPSLTDGRHRP